MSVTNLALVRGRSSTEFTFFRLSKTQRKRCRHFSLSFRRHKEEEKSHNIDVQMGNVNQNGEEHDNPMNQEITLTLLLNRIYGGKYKHPNDFWVELGQMFKIVNQKYPDDSMSIRKISDKMRVLSYHLYVSSYLQSLLTSYRLTGTHCSTTKKWTEKGERSKTRELSSSN
jgi:hypothetical protein